MKLLAGHYPLIVNMQHHSPHLVAKIVGWFQAAEKPEVLEFLKLYGEYIELVDDFVDKDNGEINPLDITNKALEVFSCNYWRANAHFYYLIDKVNRLTYMDSNKMMESDIEWIKQDGKALSHCAYNLLFAVLVHELGDKFAEEISYEFRINAHKEHLYDKNIQGSSSIKAVA